MLGLSSGLMYEGFVSEDVTPTVLTINDCVAWYDFTDTTTMWQDGNPSSGHPYFNQLPPADPVASDGDDIDRIYNKVWTLLETKNALGKYLSGSNADYKIGGANGHSYVTLNGAGSRLNSGLGGNGGVGDVIDEEWDGDQTVDLSAYKGTWPLSESTINLAAFTIFLVADPKHRDGRAFSIFGDKEDNNDSSRKEFHLYYDKYNSASGSYKIDCYDGSTNTTISSGTSGKSDNLHIVTGVLSGSGDSQLYRDGDNTDGTTSASSGSGSIDITHSNPDIYEKENRIIIGRNMNLGSISDTTAGVSPNWDWGNQSDDRIYEIICYNRELTSEELSTIETHLKEKYDIS
tara:strand:- start:1030 stop:2067 length:1038 start_codon:yes stop_codon:yes gene_type:complete